MRLSNLDYGYILSIADLRLVLSAISGGSKRWWNARPLLNQLR
jgi:hypothetical protein